MKISAEYDVVICGAGLAGLTLARQITKEIPDASLLLLEGVADKRRRTVLNVGESTVEVSAHYLGDILGLRDYLQTTHFRKMGFRFFFGKGSDAFQDRPEFGIARPSALASFQLDRALLETDLKALNETMGIEMVEGGKVESIVLAEGDNLHEITFTQAATRQRQTVRSRWVVDAMGRRRFLQKMLGWEERHTSQHSAAWFRLEGRIDVCDLVPRIEAEWHARVPDDGRYFSTNHLMGNGRWVWLIPLASGYTSIGIVAREDFFSFTTYCTYERALTWLQVHEPALRNLIGSRQPVDFQCLRHYSYSAKQVFSHQRWACTGDAAVFSDPFLSPGIDQLGFANTLITDMIKQDCAGALQSETVEYFNQVFLNFNVGTTWLIQQAYPFFGDSLVMGAKLFWDIVRGWALNGPQRFNRIYLDKQKAATLNPVLSRLFFLTTRMEKLFREWTSRTRKKYTYQFFDYLAAPGVMDLYLRNLQPDKSIEALSEDHSKTLDYFEELAQVIFLIALADTMPEMFAQLPSPLWLNAWGVGLDPERWQADKLFTPTSHPRALPVNEFFHLFGDIPYPFSI